MEALVTAIKNKNLNGMRTILDANPGLVNEKIASVSDSFGIELIDVPPLLLAVNFNYLDGVRLLVERGADVNVLDKRGGNALFTAISVHKNIDMVNFLLEQGINVNVQDKMSMSPLRVAAALPQARPDIVRALLTSRTDIDTTLRDSDGKTALEKAKTSEIKRMIEEYITEQKLNNVIGNKSKLEAFTSARKTQKLPPELVGKIMKQAGIEPPPKGVDPTSPLGYGGKKRKTRRTKKARKTRRRR